MSKALENTTYQELLKANRKLEHQLSHMEIHTTDLESKISQLQFQIDQMNRLLFGSKRERFVQNTDENQMTLPFEVEQEEAPEKEKEVVTYVREKKKRKNHPGRLPLPSHLPVEEIVLERPPHDDLKDVLTAAIANSVAPSRPRYGSTTKKKIRYNNRFGGRVV